MGWGAIISGVIGAGVSLLGSAGGPNYPSPPKVEALPVNKAKRHMQKYEADRMGVSLAEFKKKFPKLQAGGEYLIGDIARNQRGLLSPTISDTLTKSGLALPKQGNQYKMAQDIGLNPITLAQRTSQAAIRNIAMNPEWTNKISGGTLASMMANAAANQQAYTGMLGSIESAKQLGQMQANTEMLTAGLGAIGGAASTYFGARASGALGREEYLQGAQGTPTAFPTTPAGYSGGSVMAPQAPTNAYSNLSLNASPQQFYDPYGNTGMGNWGQQNMPQINVPQIGTGMNMYGGAGG